MKILLAFAAAAAAYGAAPASARDAAPAPRFETVRFGDLDLTSEAGRRTLDRRLAQAVRTVCGEASDVDVHGKTLTARCRTDTARALSARREAALASARTGSADRLASGR